VACSPNDTDRLIIVKTNERQLVAIGRSAYICNKGFGETVGRAAALEAIKRSMNCVPFESSKNVTSYLHKTDVGSDIYEEVIKNLHISFPDSLIEYRESGIFIDWN
jgi:hypothetical protein